MKLILFYFSFKSPLLLRSGRKGKKVPLSAATDNRVKVRRLLSASSATSETATTTPADNKCSEKFDPALLSGDDVFQRLVTKLTDMTATVGGVR